MKLKDVAILNTSNSISLENNKGFKIFVENSEKKNDINNLSFNGNISKKRKLKKIENIKMIFLFLYFIIIILVENLYRNPLFNKSLNIQEKIKGNKTKNDSFYLFWKIISAFGGEKIIIPLYLIFFLFFPLNISFFILMIIIYNSFFIGLFKMIYKEKRPYWESETLDIVCNKQYGNPSGHSMMSTCLYLSLSHILCNYFSYIKKNKFLKVFIFVTFSILTILIMISRFILTAHSFNQILYGFTLGLGFYFLFIHIYSFHTYNALEFLKLIFNIKIVIIFTIINLIFLFICAIAYFSIKEDEEFINEMYKKVFNGVRCKIPKKYLAFKNGGLNQSLLITALIGAHFGLKLLEILLRNYNYNIDKYINEFNQSSIKRWFIRLCILIFSLIGIGFYFAIPNNSNLYVIYIFKSNLAYFLCLFGLHSVGIFLSIHLNVANENISKI